MFLSLTIATIAAMIGSTLSRLKTEADGNEEEREIASSSGKKVDGQESITLSKNEMVLLEDLTDDEIWRHVLATKAENEDKDKNWSKEDLFTRQEASSCMPSA